MRESLSAAFDAGLEKLQHALDIIGAAAREAGRDAGSIGMEARVTWAPADTDRFSTQVEEWRQVGATHLSIDTMSIGLTTVDDHIAALEHAAGVIALVPKSNGQ